MTDTFVKLMFVKYIIKDIPKVKAVLLVIALIPIGVLSGAMEQESERYQAYLGDTVAVEVSTELTGQNDTFKVKRVSVPKNSLAKMVADKVTEDSVLEARKGYFRTQEYNYSESGEATIKAVVGDDNIVRISNGKEFQLNQDDIVIDMGSLQYIFKFLAPDELSNKTVKVVTHKRVDVYKFSEVKVVELMLDERNETISAINISAHDVNRPGRFSEFWLDPNQGMLMVKMVQQSEKKRMMLPNSMTLKIM